MNELHAQADFFVELRCAMIKNLIVKISIKEDSPLLSYGACAALRTSESRRFPEILSLETSSEWV